jgi:RNA polymerase-binding transcription factor DksA
MWAPPPGGRQPLTALERLRLRDALQDLWREQVREITELSLGIRDHAESAPAGARTRTLQPATMRALIGARESLEEIERATRRLDDRSYGRCVRCGLWMSMDWLLDRPNRQLCSSCDPAPVGSHVAADER